MDFLARNISPYNLYSVFFKSLYLSYTNYVLKYDRAVFAIYSNPTVILKPI